MGSFVQPTTLNEALELLSSKENIAIMAGGTDLIVGMKNKTLTPDIIMDCKRIPDLRFIKINDGKLEIGAAVTLNELIESDLLVHGYSIIKKAASETANHLLRNRATLVGNICNASPAGDMIPACLVLEAELEMISAKGSRVVALKDFFTGTKKHILNRDEIVTKVIISQKKGYGQYLKKRRIRGHDLAQVGVSGFYDDDGRLNVALGAVAPVPIVLENICVCDQAQLRKEKVDIVEKVTARISPITDLRSTKEYRKAMVKHLLGIIIDDFSESKEVMS